MPPPLVAWFPPAHRACADGNHKEVGEAIAAHSVPRDQIWLTSKVGFFPERPEGFDGEIYWYRDDNVKGGEAASIVSLA